MRKLIALLFATTVAFAPAQAADSTVSAMTAATALTGTELIYCVQGGADRKCTAGQINRPRPAYVASNWYLPGGHTTTTTGVSAPLNATTTYCNPGFVDQTLTISQLGVKVATSNAGNVQVAIYNDAATMAGKTLIDKTGSMSTASTVAVGSVLLGGNKQVAPGIYWFCLMADNTTANYLGYGSTETFYNQQIGSSTIGNVLNGGATTTEGIQLTPITFGTWPSDLTGATEITAALRTYAVGFLVNSVP